MVQMDVDVHSPTPRSLRYRSAKRARSPDSTSTVDTRPSKRISLAGELFMPYHTSPLGLDARMGRLVDNSVGRGRPSSVDDWIVQTKGLSIDSPLFDGLRENGNVHLIEKDEYMVIDPGVDEDACREQVLEVGLQADGNGTRLDQGPRLAPPPASGYTTMPGIGVSALPAMIMPDRAAYAPSQAPSAPMEHSQEESSFPGSMGSTVDANVIPATYLEHEGMQNHIGRASSLPAAVGASVPTSRRPRFTMGPRSDCEKCRLGVKGHAVHLD